MALDKESLIARYKEMEVTELELWPLIVTRAFNLVAKGSGDDDIRIEDGIEILKIHFARRDRRVINWS